jgi:hypothetical protein
LVDVRIGAGVKELGIYRPKEPEPEPEPAHAEDGGHGHGAHAPEKR